MTSSKDGILTLVFIVSGIILAVLIKIPLFIGFGMAFLLVIALMLYRGYKPALLFQSSITGLNKIKPLIWILFFIALLIPVWISSGTIPAMIHLSSSLIQPNWLVLSAFLITAITSFILGTSIGTLGSFGIVLLGVAHSSGVSVPLVAGALISGAFFGDRCSPLSPMFHLTANTLELQPVQQFKNMLFTTIVTFSLCTLIYLLLGLTTSATINLEANNVQYILAQEFNISFFAFAPIIVLFSSIFLRFSIIKALAIGTVTGCLVSILYQNIPMISLFQNMLLGYTSAPLGLEKILRGGGLLRMSELMIFILFAGMMNGVISRIQLFQPIILALYKKAKSLTNYTWRTVCLTILFAMIGCNQAFPILLTSQSLQKIWSDMNFDKNHLGRIICDTAIVTSGLIPWNMVAVLSVAAIHVPTVEYAFYAFLLWLSPIVTIVYSYFISFKTRNIAAANDQGM